MNVGFMGLGKLGLPCALAIEAKGHRVVGYDPDENIKKILETKELPYREAGSSELLKESSIQVVTVPGMVQCSDIIFVAIQTPHADKYEGITRLPKERVDFKYSFLGMGVRLLALEIEKQKKDKVVIIISTVLPGTLRARILPNIDEHTHICYNPFFIAMGTTVADFLNPEFVLFGVDDAWAANIAEEFYKTIHDKPFIRMSIESAELTKVAYNTMITSKIVIANTLMEICHKTPNAHIDDVTGALKLATDRVVSPRYMEGGMGDGGGCHPRDAIALSWLAKNLGLSHDIYEDLMSAREDQTEWLAQLIIKEHEKFRNYPIVILGKAFKPETNLTVGSPSILLKNILEETMGEGNIVMWDPFLDGALNMQGPCFFFIGTKHPGFVKFPFPPKSVIIDPFRYIPDIENVKIIKVGVGK